MSQENLTLINNYNTLKAKPFYVFKEEYNTFDNWLYVVKHNPEMLSELPSEYNKELFFEKLLPSLDLLEENFYKKIDINQFPIKFLLSEFVLEAIIIYQKEVDLTKKLKCDNKTYFEIIKRLISISDYYIVNYIDFERIENKKEIITLRLEKGDNTWGSSILWIFLKYKHLFSKEEHFKILDKYFCASFSKYSFCFYENYKYLISSTICDEFKFNFNDYINDKLNFKADDSEENLKFILVFISFYSKEQLIEYLLNNQDYFLKKERVRRFFISEINKEKISLSLYNSTKKLFREAPKLVFEILSPNEIRDLLEIDHIQNEIYSLIEKHVYVEETLKIIVNNLSLFDFNLVKDFIIKNFELIKFDSDSSFLLKTNLFTKSDLSYIISNLEHKFFSFDLKQLKERYYFYIKRKDFFIMHKELLSYEFIKTISLSYDFLLDTNV